mgnify:CR=1 FL=1|jgi:hypothetical protein
MQEKAGDNRIKREDEHKKQGDNHKNGRTKKERGNLYKNVG